MLRNADHSSFASVYVVCGYTDMRLGIDSLATIIQSRYHLPVFTPEVLFLFCDRRATKIKGLLWEGDGFLLLTKRVESGHFKGLKVIGCWVYVKQKYTEIVKSLSKENPYAIIIAEAEKRIS